MGMIFVLPNNFHEFLDFHGVCCYLPFCIPDSTNLGFFSPHFSQVCQELSILFIFSKNQLFVSFFVWFFWFLFH
jgi:hypothetical protein